VCKVSGVTGIEWVCVYKVSDLTGTEWVCV